jgi:VanZ family protein
MPDPQYNRRYSSLPMRPALLTSVLGAYVLVLLVMLLAPLDFYTRNGAMWMPAADGIAFTTPGIVRSTSPPVRLHADLTSSRGFTAEVWLTSHSAGQTGPARILSYSASTRSRNFTIAQDGNALVVRLRTPRTNDNGIPEVKVPRVVTPGRRQHVVVTYDLELLCVYVDGRRTCTESLGGNLRRWDPSHHLLLGNEVAGNRPWLGTIFLVALYNQALASKDIERAHEAGLATAASLTPTATEGLVALYRLTERAGTTIADSSNRPPVRLTIPITVEARRAFLSAESRLFSWPPTPYAILDGVLNLTMFVPLGLLSCTLLEARGWKPLTASIIVIATTAALSLGVESAQYFLMSRASERQDVILNVISAGIGAMVYWAARRRTRTRSAAQ